MKYQFHLMFILLYDFKKILFLVSLTIFGFALISFTNPLSVKAQGIVIIPDSVQKILNKSCIECHHSNSKNKKGKKKLEFDKLANLKTYQVVGKMVDVADIIVSNDMPPRRFVKKHPEKALTYRERQILVNWVNELTAQPRPTRITLESQLKDLEAQLAGVLKENQKINIAVLEYYNDSNDYTKLGRYISEELSTGLYFTEGLKVKQRYAINQLLVQNQYIPEDTLTKESAMKLGKILSVDVIIYGNIEDLTSSVRVNNRILSAETGKLFSEISVDIPKDEKVSLLLSKIIEKPFDLYVRKKNTKPITAEPVPLPLVEKGGFIFELVDAYVIDSTLLCKLRVTNPGDNHKDFRMRAWFKEAGNTVAIDDTGSEYYISSAKFDGKLVKEMFNVHKTTKTIYAGTSLNLELHFKDELASPEDAKNINALKIISEIEPWFTVEFRNIPLNKK